MERTDFSHAMNALHEEVLRLLDSVTRESSPEGHIDLTHLERKLRRWSHAEPVPAHMAAEVVKPASESTEEPA